MMLPILMQSCHRHDLYNMANNEFHDSRSVRKLSGALTIIAYQISADHGVVYKTVGLSGKKQGGSTVPSGVTKGMASPTLSQRSKRACSETASEYLSTVRDNVSVRAVRAKLFQQAEPKLWDVMPDTVSGIRLKPSKDGTPRLPKCRAIDYGTPYMGPYSQPRGRKS